MADAKAAGRALTDAGAREVMVFGSVARGDAGPHSDIDLVAVFDDVDYRTRWQAKLDLGPDRVRRGRPHRGGLAHRRPRMGHPEPQGGSSAKTAALMSFSIGDARGGSIFWGEPGDGGAAHPKLLAFRRLAELLAGCRPPGCV